MIFDEFGFKDEIEIMNIQRQIQNKHFNNHQTIGLNSDTLYNFIDEKK